jgi:arabinogalactan oligomer / maltooligosaccharide transport system permease protein
MFDFEAAKTALLDAATTLVVLVIATIIIEAILYVILVRWRRSRLAFPMMLLAPGVVAVLLLYGYPLLYELNISFTKMNIRNFVQPGLLGLTWEGTILEGTPLAAERDIFVGIDNYVNVFTQPVLRQTSVYQLFVQTVIWTVINVFFHVMLGIGLALALNRKLRGRTVYRALLILPWAIPVVASLQVWRTEFNYEFGAVNQILGIFGLGPIPWMSDAFWNFVAMILTNIWLGVPFMMVITLGGLQAISNEYYEAAEIDGATARQSFRAITLPLLRPVLIPAVLLGTFLTFNNVTVPFFINAQQLETSDILVTGVYRAGIQYTRFGFGAAFAFVVFAILLVFTVWYVRQTKVLKGAYES